MKGIRAAEPSLRCCDAGLRRHLGVQGTLPRNCLRWCVIGPRGEGLGVVFE